MYCKLFYSPLTLLINLSKDNETRKTLEGREVISVPQIFGMQLTSYCCITGGSIAFAVPNKKISPW
jgi:hypothetical protein